jgi:polyphosphate kinase 2 (PPK2 family)
MHIRQRLLERFVVRPGEAAGIAARDPGWTGGTEFPDLAADERQQRAIDALERGSAELSEAQELLWASDRYALLIVLQAMDAAGKDSVIKHVMDGVNPQGVQVVSFKQPSSEELGHDFLWRISRALPERGPHRHLQPLALRGGRRAQGAPRVARAAAAPARRARRGVLADALRGHQRFERHLDRSGTKVVKFFLHVSKAAQKERFLARLDQPGKEWKFNAADVAERPPLRRVPRRVRGRADGDLDAVGAVVRVPADHWWITQAIVAQVLVDTLGARSALARGLARGARREPAGAQGARGRAPRA